MKYMTHKLVLGAVGSVLVMLAAGCGTPSHKEARNQAMDRWTSARAGIVYGLAVQQFESGDLAKAQRTANQALSIKPDNARFNVLAARIAMESGELERAYRHLEIAVANDEASGDAHYLTGVLMQRWQRYEQALSSYELAFKVEPDNIAPLLAAAEMLVKLDRAEQAVARLEEKAVYFEHNADLRLALGRILLKQREYDRAMDYFNQAHLLAPDDPMVLEQLALAEYAAKRPAEAIHHLTRLMEDSDRAARRDLRMVLADCYQSTGRADKSRAILMELTREDNSDVNAWIKLGQSAWIAGDIARLRQAAERTLSLAPDRYEGHLLYGLAARESGRVDEALASFDRAASLSPDSALPHLMAGMTWQAQGERRAAADAYSRAMQADPADHRARQLLAAMVSSDTSP